LACLALGLCLAGAWLLRAGATPAAERFALGAGLQPGAAELDHAQAAQRLQEACASALKLRPGEIRKASARLVNERRAHANGEFQTVVRRVWQAELTTASGQSYALSIDAQSGELVGWEERGLSPSWPEGEEGWILELAKAREEAVLAYAKTALAKPGEIPVLWAKSAPWLPLFGEEPHGPGSGEGILVHVGGKEYQILLHMEEDPSTGTITSRVKGLWATGIDFMRKTGLESSEYGALGAAKLSAEEAKALAAEFFPLRAATDGPGEGQLSRAEAAEALLLHAARFFDLLPAQIQSSGMRFSASNGYYGNRPVC
jgi:hypothetical protein